MPSPDCSILRRRCVCGGVRRENKRGREGGGRRQGRGEREGGGKGTRGGRRGGIRELTVVRGGDEGGKGPSRPPPSRPTVPERSACLKRRLGSPAVSRTGWAGCGQSGRLRPPRWRGREERRERDIGGRQKGGEEGERDEGRMSSCRPLPAPPPRPPARPRPSTPQETRQG